MCAVFYPSHCSLRNLVWTAQKRTRLVAEVSASARTSVFLLTRARGITALPTECVSWTFSLCSLLQAAAPPTDPVRTSRQERATPAPTAALPRQANSPPTSTPPLHQRSPTPPPPHLPLPLTTEVLSPLTTSFPRFTTLPSTSPTISLLSRSTLVPPTETRRLDSSRANASTRIS